MNRYRDWFRNVWLIKSKIKILQLLYLILLTNRILYSNIIIINRKITKITTFKIWSLIRFSKIKMTLLKISRSLWILFRVSRVTSRFSSSIKYCSNNSNSNKLNNYSRYNRNSHNNNSSKFSKGLKASNNCLNNRTSLVELILKICKKKWWGIWIEWSNWAC